MRWILPDIHGCYYTLDSLLRRIRETDSEAEFVFVGDYIDRGKHNVRVVDKMIELKSDGAICLRGNHDDVFDYILNDHSECYLSELMAGVPTRDKAIPWMMRNGLDNTFDSYSITSHRIHTGPYGQKVAHRDLLEEILEKVPEDHQKFFNELPIWWESDTHFACHAYYDPDRDLPRDVKFMKKIDDHDALWSRFGQHNRDISETKAVWHKIGIFGHTPTVFYNATSGPLSHGKLRLIDCGSFMGKGMASYCCETDEFVFVESEKKDLIKKWQ